MAIRLQSTVGGFSPEFMRKLPELENAMLAHGLEPSNFVISKDRASPEGPWIGPFFYQHTVFIGKENFTITEPNDLRFYEYLYDRCIAEPEDDDIRLQQHPRRPGLIRRIFRWMEQPIWARRTKANSPKATRPIAAPWSRARSPRNSARP